MRIEPAVPKGNPLLTRSNPETTDRKSANRQADAMPNNEVRLSEKELIAAIVQANQKLQINNHGFDFSIHEATKEIIVRVIDLETEEVIKEIPPEQILDLVAKLMELAGIFVDERG